MDRREGMKILGTGALMLHPIGEGLAALQRVSVPQRAPQANSNGW